MSLNILHGCDHILVSVPLCVYRGNSPPHGHSRRTYTHPTITIVHSFIINIIIALGGVFWLLTCVDVGLFPSPTRTWCPSSFSLSHEWAWQSHHHHQQGEWHTRFVACRHGQTFSHVASLVQAGGFGLASFVFKSWCALFVVIPFDNNNNAHQ